MIRDCNREYTSFDFLIETKWVKALVILYILAYKLNWKMQ